MTRKNARRLAVRLVYSYDYSESDVSDIISDFFAEEHYSSLAEEDELFNEVPGKSQLDYINTILQNVKEHLSEIDAYISARSETRKIERISKTALAVLRCAISEILYMSDIPDSVSINEAVEIAKSFDTSDTVSFINGVLGSVSREKSSDGEE